MHSLTQATPFPRMDRLPAHSGRYALWLAGAVLLVTLSIISSQNITPAEYAYAGVLLSISIQAYLSWTRARNIRTPVWALVCAAHFVFYGLAIFGPLRKSPSAFDHGSDVPDSAIATAMLVGIAGLLSMATGRMAIMHFASCKNFRLSLLETGPHTHFRIRALLVLGTVANLLRVP